METLLIISFSHLDQDARLRRQIELFSGTYRVITAGFGPGVPGAAHHVELALPPSGRRRKLRAYLEAVLLRLHTFRFMYDSDPMVRSARRALRGVHADRVLANDINTVPIALGIAPATHVHADLHEFYPGLHDDNADWVRLRKPYFDWLLRGDAQRVASVTTVGEGVATAYRSYGINAGIVTNAPGFTPRSPGVVREPIRLVHAGAALPSRHIEVMMRAVAASSADVDFTLYLAPNTPAYLEALRTLADTLGSRIRVLPPVPQRELVDVLGGYDVGIHLLPATVTNQALSLPNKFFDFVQARLGIIVGPTPGMAMLVEKHKLGAVTVDFSEAALREAIDSLDVATVTAWKSAANEAALALSAQSQLPVWVDAIAGLGSSSSSR